MNSYLIFQYPTSFNDVVLVPLANACLSTWPAPLVCLFWFLQRALDRGLLAWVDACLVFAVLLGCSLFG
jgi:hypothetical protein